MCSIKVREKIIRWACLEVTTDALDCNPWHLHTWWPSSRQTCAVKWHFLPTPPPPSFRLPRLLRRTVLNPKYKMIDSIPALSHHPHSFLGSFISSTSSISPAINCTLFLYFMECRVTVISLSWFRSLPGSFVWSLQTVMCNSTVALICGKQQTATLRQKQSFSHEGSGNGLPNKYFRA